MTTEPKTALVTGATSGIGKAIATGLARAGAHVTVLARNRERGESTLAEIRKAAPESHLELLLCDLSSQRSVREAVAAFKKKHDRLHILVNCAGVFLPTRTVTEDGVEATFATNYLGPFLLTNLLLPLLKKAAPSRIVNVAS